MAASADTQAAEVAALVDAQAASTGQLSKMAVGVAANSARAFTGWYDHHAIAVWARQLAALIEAIQAQAASVTDGYLTDILSAMRGKHIAPPGTINVAGLRRGVDHATVYGRVTDTYRYQVSLDKPPEEALRVAVERAQTIADTDVALAVQHQSRAFMEAKQVTGWRRVIHPELSRGGTCGLCIAAADRVYKRNDLMPLHDNCVAGDTVVAGLSVSAVTRRHYPGPFVVLTTASGQQLRITSNHPVLTDQGWLPAHLVDIGDQVVRHRFGHRVTGRSPQEHQRPATVEQVWRAATVDHGLHPRAMPLATEHFHGDGIDGEVDVVAADGLLAQIGDVSFVEPSSESPLVAGHRPLVLFPSQSGPLEPIFGLGSAADRFICPPSDPLALCTTHAHIADRLGLAVAPGGDTGLLEAPVDHGSGYPIAARDGQHRFAGLVPANDLLVRQTQPSATRFDPAFLQFSAESRGAYVQLGRDLRERLAGDVELDCVVEKRWVEGPHVVYNLQTAEGWYAADSFIVSNCHCTVTPVVGEHDPGHKLNRADLDALYKQAGGTGRQQLAKVRFAVHDHSELGPILGVHGQHWRSPADLAA